MSGTPASPVLIRLYDAVSECGHGERPAGRPARRSEVLDALALAGDETGAEQIRLAFAGDPVRAAVVGGDGKLLGCCVYDAAGRGTIGPVFLAPALPGEVRQDLVRAACRMMLRAGYWYALTDGSGDLADCVSLLPEASVTIPDPPPRSPDERDVTTPWADLFLPLGEEFEADAPDHFEAGQRTIYICRPLPAHRLRLTRWVAEEFTEAWGAEVEAAFDQHPVSVLFASTSGLLRQTDDLLGFVAYGVTALGMIGPTALRTSVRGTQTAAVLIDRCLRELRRDGFDYALFGGIGRRRGALRGMSQAWAVPGSYPALFQVKRPKAEATDA